MQTDRDGLLARYLLGSLTEAEERELELRYFTDDLAFERLHEVETELVDAYVRGELSQAERRGLEERLLKSQRVRGRLHFSEALHRTASERPNRAAEMRRFTFALTGSRFLVATAALLLLAVGITLWRAPAIAPGRGGTAQTPVPAPIGPHIETRPVVLAITLAPGLVRGDDSRTAFEVPSDVNLIRLHVNTSLPAAPEYRVTVTKVTGEQVFCTTLVRHEGDTKDGIDVDVPRPALPAGDYILTLAAGVGGGGYEDFADCYFRLVREE